MKKYSTILAIVFSFTCLTVFFACKALTELATNSCFLYNNNSIEVNAGDAIPATEVGSFGTLASGIYTISITQSGNFNTQNVQASLEGTAFPNNTSRLVNAGDRLTLTGFTSPNDSGSNTIRMTLRDINNSIACEITFVVSIRPRNNALWNVAYGGNTTWQQLAVNGFFLAELGFGDFDGDQATDIIAPTGTEWLVSYRGTSAWTTLATSGYQMNELGLGDFDGDGITDLLRTSGTQWAYASSQNGWSWTPLAASGYKLDELGLGDFDGDGITDLLRASGTQWIFCLFPKRLELDYLSRFGVPVKSIKHWSGPKECSSGNFLQ